MKGDVRSWIAIWLGQTLALAAVIFVTGRLALMIAVASGDATPIFPPAGIALATLLLYGNQLSPGVFLGSLLINCTLGPVGFALGIAAGSTLQALLAAWLIRHFVGFPTALTLEGKAIRFLLLGGPLACVIAATMGTAVLEFGGALDRSQREFNWLNWWVGDSIGVIIFAPLVLTLFGRPPESWRPRRLSLGLPLLLLAAAVSIAFVYASYREHAAIEFEFERQIEARLEAASRRIKDHEDVLLAIQSLYASSLEVERREFRSFVSGALKRYPGIQALEWAPQVTDAEREEFIERARHEAERDVDEAVANRLRYFELTEQPTEQRHGSGESTPAAQRPVHYPVYFVEPFENNEEALGYDLASNPERRKALVKACDRGKMVATGRIQLVQDPTSGYGLLAMVPIFKNNAETLTKEARRRHLLGYVLGVFRVADAIQPALRGLSASGIRLQLRDLSAPAEQQILFDDGTVADAGNCAFDAERDIGFADRRWSLTFMATPEFVNKHRQWQAWAMPVAILLVAGLVTTFLLVATGHAMEVQQLVDARTEELRHTNDELQRSNRDLEQFAYAASHDLQEPLRAVSGFCGLLKRKYDGTLDAQARDYVDFAVDGANRMQRLLLDLLEFARINTQRSTVADSDFNEVLAAVREQMKVSIETSGAQITQDDLPVVHADSSQMIQLTQNLISNAIKYCKAPRPEIHVSAKQEKSRWTFTVRDNGIGIDEIHRERIFVIFQRLHSREEYEGTGIGLALCKRIVERHHGRIWLESTPGAGTTFFFTIPNNEKH